MDSFCKVMKQADLVVIIFPFGLILTKTTGKVISNNRGYKQIAPEETDCKRQPGLRHTEL
jgi:hypothetical protein